jgi:hypothetical protein
MHFFQVIFLLRALGVFENNNNTFPRKWGNPQRTFLTIILWVKLQTLGLSNVNQVHPHYAMMFGMLQQVTQLFFPEIELRT